MAIVFQYKKKKRDSKQFELDYTMNFLKYALIASIRRLHNCKIVIIVPDQMALRCSSGSWSLSNRFS
ncbi:hypothetical protein U27_06413 [Candidatus Vecturithrix granuli]|uniref:Uncharacterized protein n=1 Tax=Vecturithrix granuli TaxID=1499967 RepID=A0A081C4C4_VECG1|nr:hypothetical protein U27_06413 [Candidatus Vecturithrix granuli]